MSDSRPAQDDKHGSSGWAVALLILVAVMSGLWFHVSRQPEVGRPAPPSATPDYPAKGVWKMPTDRGELTIIYRETPSAAGKMAVRIDVQQGTFVIENLLDVRIAAAAFYRLTHRNGAVETIGQSTDVAIMAPKQKTSGRLDAFADSDYSMIELWYLVTA